MKELKKNFNMKILCIMLLILKVIWICIHMSLHHQDIVNPWKLGGYAMYTAPPITYQAKIYSIEGNNIQSIENENINYLNMYAKAGCFSGISKRFYKNIPHQRPDLMREDTIVRINFFEKKNELLVAKTNSKKIGNAILKIGFKKIHIEESFCNKNKKILIHVR